MAKYKEFDAVLLKDGRIATIVEAFEAGEYIADVGHSPRDWDIVWSLSDADIERLATEDEVNQNYGESKRQLKEMGLWGDEP